MVFVERRRSWSGRNRNVLLMIWLHLRLLPGQQAAVPRPTGPARYEVHPAHRHSPWELPLNAAPTAALFSLGCAYEEHQQVEAQTGRSPISPARLFPQHPSTTAYSLALRIRRTTHLWERPQLKGAADTYSG